MRNSMFAIPVYKPRWRPWSPLRAVVATLAFGAVMAILVLLTYRVEPAIERLVVAIPRLHPRPVATEVVAVHAAPLLRRELPRADANLARENRSPVSGAILTIPPAFASEDGGYDVLIHFHGNTALVDESVTETKLNAVLVQVNLGVGSGPYEDRMGYPGAFSEMLDRIQATMEKRGLAQAKLRRLGLSAWSAGYGAVLKILEQPALADKVNAVLLLDGIHVGYVPDTNQLLLPRLSPFERFAKRAALGQTLFSITHSNITPMGNYAGTRETTDALLRALGITRARGGEAIEIPPLKSLEGVLPKKKMVPLEPETQAKAKGFRVRGYAGVEPEQHMMHLIQMSKTVLPDLVAWWSNPAAFSASTPL